MIWDSPIMAVMVAMSSKATSDPVRREGRLKSPETISLENTNLSTNWTAEAGTLLHSRKAGTQQQPRWLFVSLVYINGILLDYLSSRDG